jgi:hypothetical protein
MTNAHFREMKRLVLQHEFRLKTPVLRLTCGGAGNPHRSASEIIQANRPFDRV